MSGLKITTGLCRGCALCVKACDHGAVSIENGKAVVDSARCTLCGICVQSCVFGAILIEKADTGEGVSVGYGVWVFCEQTEGKFLPVAFELIGKGRELADELGVPLTALAAGYGLYDEARLLASAGADKVVLCDAPHLATRAEGPYSDAVSALIDERRPDIFLFGATEFGRSLAPRLAARHRTGLTADCTVLEIDRESRLLYQTRPAFGGNLMATIVTRNSRPQMVTVRPGIFKAPALHDGSDVIIEVISPPETPSGVRLIESRPIPKGFSIADADVIISAGRGIGSKKNLKLVYELAELIGASVGVSRPLVDMGWCDYKHQIGQTGLSVSPKLLIACGISGAIQHLAGIGGAETIVAINSDPDAQIFSVADYKLVGDCTEILNALIESVRKNTEV
ncbi:MAG: FAD-binding protein [Oscillospiraceae bacterium]